MPDKKEPEDFKNSFVLARAWSIGGGIVFLCFGGYFLDQHFHKENFYVLIGFGVGILFTVWEIYKTIREQK